MIVISDNIFSKYIENDNTKIELILRKIIVIYSKFLKRKKLKYFLKYKTNSIIIKKKKKKKNKKRNNSLKERNVHDRLFDDSIIRQEMLNNLLNKYLIDEEEKYTFYPKINSKDSNYYYKYPYLYEGADRKLLTERKMRPKTFNIKYLFNNNNNYDDFTSSYINKYIGNLKTRKNNGFNSTSSLSCSHNINFSDLNTLYNTNFNQSYKYIPICQNTKRSKKRNSIPISTKYKNKLYNSMFRDKDNIIKKGNIYNLNRTSSSSLYPKTYFGNNNSLYNTSYNNNNNKSNNRSDFYNNLNTKAKKNSKNKKIEINKIKGFIAPDKNNKKFFDKNIIDKNYNINNFPSNEKLKLFSDNSNSNNNNNNCRSSNSFNRNSNSSLYNISSIGCSMKEDNHNIIDEQNKKFNKNNNKSKSKSKNLISPEKKEHLFSFGSDLFFIDNNNPNHVNVINKSLIEKMQKKANNTEYKNDRKKNMYNYIKNNRNNNRNNNNNNKARTQNNVNTISGNNHISTNFSGSYSIHNNNNNNNNSSIICNKNEKEKNNNMNNMNKLEMQSTNDYCIINDRSDRIDDFKFEGLNFQTSIQTLSDSKILDLANDYMSVDDSLESYRKKSVLYNKKHV